DLLRLLDREHVERGGAAAHDDLPAADAGRAVAPLLGRRLPRAFAGLELDAVDRAVALRDREEALLPARQLDAVRGALDGAADVVLPQFLAGRGIVGEEHALPRPE